MQLSLRHFIAWAGALLGVAFIGSGLLVDETVQWRLHLLAGLWLLSLPARALLDVYLPMKNRDSTQMVTRGLARLALVLGLGFSAVALQLARNQVTAAEEIIIRAEAILDPPVPVAVVEEDTAPIVIPPAERTTLGNGRIWPVEVDFDQRGTIFDRQGNVLAISHGGRRVYPNPNVGHIVGFQSVLYGTSGVEHAFDGYLSGKRSLAAVDLLEARLLETSVEAQSSDLYLTLDTAMQQIAQAALGQRQGAVVLLDPRSGAVLALATYPRFDPNLLVLPTPASESDLERLRTLWDGLSNRPDSPLLNRATQGRYPPGSIIKTLTAAAALDSGVLEFPESPITCPNRFVAQTTAPPVRNAVEGLAGLTGNPSNLRMVYTWSCNTAFAQIGLLLGPETFSDYAARFGLYHAEQVANVEPDMRDTAADVGTIASDPNFLQRSIALADTAFGQGQILATPLDMAQMVAAIANDGRLMRPYLVQEARRNGQVVYAARPEMLRQVIAPHSAQRMRSIMQSSVEIGYASPAALPGVKVGGKTGTAEVPYGAPHSWFVAIAPVDQPRFAISVIVENGGEGSLSALPVARQVLAAALARNDL